MTRRDKTSPANDDSDAQREPKGAKAFELASEMYNHLIAIENLIRLALDRGKFR
jgi:hypothetical protein